MTPMEKAEVIRKKDARRFVEGNEFCRCYLETENLTFGVSILHPGMRGEVDPGHKEEDELFYVAKGRVLLHLPDEDTYEELDTGDAILIPPPRPHALINIGQTMAIVTWSKVKS